MSEEVRDNMRIVWDAPIEMSDGVVLRADVFRPIGESTIPAILSYGPYAKGMSFAESRPFAWQRLIKTHSRRLMWLSSTSAFRATSATSSGVLSRSLW
jgi:predicted acyl esterase